MGKTAEEIDYPLPERESCETPASDDPEFCRQCEETFQELMRRVLGQTFAEAEVAPFCLTQHPIYGILWRSNFRRRGENNLTRVVFWKQDGGIMMGSFHG